MERVYSYNPGARTFQLSTVTERDEHHLRSVVEHVRLYLTFRWPSCQWTSHSEELSVTDLPPTVDMGTSELSSIWSINHANAFGPSVMLAPKNHTTSRLTCYHLAAANVYTVTGLSMSGYQSVWNAPHFLMFWATYIFYGVAHIHNRRSIRVYS